MSIRLRLALWFSNASFATLPLIGTEAILGQALYNDPYSRTSAKRGAHIAVGTAITGLFAVNSVTGVWNLVEGRHDPHHRTLRLVHGFTMLGADVGFLAAYGTGPGGRNLVNFDSQKSTHRAVVGNELHGLSITSRFPADRRRSRVRGAAGAVRRRRRSRQRASISPSHR